MELKIPKDKQITILDALIEQAECDVFRLALLINIVPETLSLNWKPPVGHSYPERDAGQLVYELERLKALKTRRDALQ